jgi:hypothetical protein
MADITMSLDDTLELDTIIKESTEATKPISIEEPADFTEGTDFDLDGIQKHTGLFNPSKSGDYKLNINGQILSVKVTEMIPETVIDNFEDQDLSEYTNGSGWDFITGYNGNYSISSPKYATNTDHIYSTPGDGLNYYPKIGSHIQYYGQGRNIESNQGWTFYWGLSDLSNYYFARADIDANTIELGYIKSGSETVKKSTNQSLSSGTWYRNDILWKDDGSDKKVWEIYDTNDNLLNSITMTDTRFDDNRGLGLRSSPTGARYDYIQVLGSVN